MSTQSSENGAVVLLSGGLDSTVALADVLTRMPVARVLTFDYGQRAFKQELKATQAIVDHYGLKQDIIALPWLARLLPQALTPVDSLKAQGLESEQTLSEEDLFDVNRVWVPNRNGLFLNIAACYAEALKAGIVVFGANAEEGASFPDNTPEFRDKLTEVFSLSTLTGVKVETPVGHLSKVEIIEKGIALNVPFHLIWSCYEGNEIQCGECPSCLRVKTAQAQIVERQGKMAGITFRQT